MRLFAVLAMLLLTTVASEASLTNAELDSVAAAPPPNARLDLSLAAPDSGGTRRTMGGLLGGRPALLTFVDYTCDTLCGTSLELLAAALLRTKLRPSDYRVLVLGLDPKDTPQAALAMEEREIPPELRAAVALLLPNQATIDRATTDLGFHYVHDTANDQFAHPAVVYVLGSDGTLRGVLSPFSLTTADIGKALADDTAPTVFERLRLRCYGYDPASGTYTPRITGLLRSAGVLTVVLLASSVLMLILVRRRVR